MKTDRECTQRDEHARTMQKVRENAPPLETIRQLAEQYRLFADTTRIRILWALLQGPLCVCDLAELLGCSQSLISHQLRLLRAARLVRYEKIGKSSAYQLDDVHVGQIIRIGLEHMTEELQEGSL